MEAIFAGASAKVREAGGTLAGGHTIRDSEPKYGLAVVGAVHPDRTWRKGGAQPGDALILTKRLGTGLLVSGARQGRTESPDLEAAISQMRTLNRAAAETLAEAAVHAATDVTGFGLLGHGLEMAQASDARFIFDAAALPALDGALDLARAGVETGGAGHNRRFVLSELSVASAVAREVVTLAHDPQTGGGLLVAVPGSHVAETLESLVAGGVEAWQIGRVEAGSGVALA
jgi:selenide,water dikinase